ncbi:secreted protein [Candidatus Magnetomorum sp. HK-1]|nr:secreted protein [Candidatus Magnetomorum sp. HK-1]
MKINNTILLIVFFIMNGNALSQTSTIKNCSSEFSAPIILLPSVKNIEGLDINFQLSNDLIKLKEQSILNTIFDSRKYDSQLWEKNDGKSLMVIVAKEDLISSPGQAIVANVQFNLLNTQWNSSIISIEESTCNDEIQDIRFVINNKFYKRIQVNYNNNCLFVNGIESDDLGADGKLGLQEVIYMLNSISINDVFKLEKVIKLLQAITEINKN